MSLPVRSEGLVVSLPVGSERGWLCHYTRGTERSWLMSLPVGCESGL